MPKKMKRMRHMRRSKGGLLDAAYLQGGGIAGLAGEATGALGEATEALNRASSAIGGEGGGSPGGFTPLPSPQPLPDLPGSLRPPISFPGPSLGGGFFGDIFNRVDGGAGRSWSSFNQGGPVYRQTGGFTPGGTAQTPDELYGVEAQTGLNEEIAANAGQPIIDTTKSAADQVKDLAAIEADPASQPDYYPGQTVTGFDAAQLEAHRLKEEAALEQNRLNQEALARAEGRLDPNSEYAQRLQRAAASRSAQQFGRSGSLGGLKSQGAVGYGTQTALLDHQRQTEQDIAGIRDKLTQGADTLAGVGAERRQYVQDVLDADIERWNVAQLAPQQQRDRVLALAKELSAIENKQVGSQAGGQTGTQSWKDLIKSSLVKAGTNLVTSGLDKFIDGLGFNQGGVVYRQEGGLLPTVENYRLPKLYFGDPVKKDEKGDPQCPPGYTWDAASNSCVRMDGGSEQAAPQFHSEESYLSPGLSVVNEETGTWSNPRTGLLHDVSYDELGGAQVDIDGDGIPDSNVGTHGGEAEIADLIGQDYDELKKEKEEDALGILGSLLTGGVTGVVTKIVKDGIAGGKSVGEVVNDALKGAGGFQGSPSGRKLASATPSLAELQSAGGDRYTGGIGDANTTVGYDSTGRGYDQNGNPTNAFDSFSSWKAALASPGHGHKDAQYNQSDNDRPGGGSSGWQSSDHDWSQPTGRNMGGPVYAYDGGMPHPGRPMGTDTVPAWLSEGEFVIDRDSTEKFRPMLEMMNRWEPHPDTPAGQRAVRDDVINGMSPRYARAKKMKMGMKR